MQLEAREGGRGNLHRTRAPVYQAGVHLLRAHPKPRPSTPDESKPTFWLQWNCRVMLRYLMGLTPVEPHQKPGVWQAWTKLTPPPPPPDIHFIQMALWQKLTVGVLLANWQPHGTACPICNQQETSQHAVSGCKYLPVAAHIAAQCMGPAMTENGPETPQ